jgi:hypothetical protein
MRQARMLCISFFLFFTSQLVGTIDFDAWLDRTSYAFLLKELIALSDTIGLLHCRLDKDERRFVEDSILGKVVRVQELVKHTDLQGVSQDDLAYLHYWISLAKGESLPELLHKQVNSLEQLFCTVIAAEPREGVSV